ncbi:hypothetical protein AZSI13_32310 [Azospira sp. I13]|uniref:phage major capsid protein n=1 Tax=Azospira sp. I13 TaxID=1765050 RepID=UPI000D475E90|nr:hypothetical protein [Azospira sp. I13]GBG03904.1 hypothetical protein AZSI13_32310 [Azospira sp. I13]
MFPPAGLRGIALREAAPDHMRVISIVRAALDAKINANKGPSAERKWFELEAVYGDKVVIAIDGKTWSYAYTLDGGMVTLEEPVEVMETFIPMKESTPLQMKEAEGQPAGVEFKAVIIRAGLSSSNVLYPETLLKEATPLFDGVRIYAMSDEEHIKGKGGRDVRKMVGWVKSPRFVEANGNEPARIEADIRLPGLPENTRALIVDAMAEGMTDLLGLSIDARGAGATRMLEGKRVKEAKSITQVDSVDLIVEPGAGGRLIRLVESAPTPNTHQSQEDSDMNLREKMLRLVEAKNPQAYAKLNPETATDDEIELAYREALVLDASQQRQTATLDAVAQAEERIRMVEARAQARDAIAASTLPQPAKDRLQRDFAARERFVEADVATAINAEREYLARFVEGNRVRMDHFTDIQVGDRSVQIAGMLDAFFDPAHQDHRNVQSFRECYVEITGDRRVTGRLEDCDRSRMRESLGGRFAEAAMDSTTFALALGDSITRRMLADYRAQSQYDVWRLVANVVPLTDFRTQERTRWGGFGDLPAVAEGADYQDGGIPDDEAATYKAAKSGRLARVTMEMVRNDDVGLIRQIPTKLSRAAKRTLAKFVLDMMRANPTIYDGKALFHVDHGNLGTAALSSTAWSAARNAMMAQLEAGSNDRLGIPPKFLLVSAAQEEGAFELFKNRGTSNDQSFIQTQAPNIVPVWYWTDANDWVAMADKLDIPGIEVGFLDGNEEPEIFVQDNPSVGSLFANDSITYKIRHIYGGAVTDFRGAYKAVVAG